MRIRFGLVTGIAALVVGLAGCALLRGPDDALVDLRAYVEERIADRDRAARMTVAIDALDAAIEGYNDMSTAVGDELRRLNRDYDATRAQLEELLRRQHAERAAARARVVDRAIELRDLATPDEWSDMAELEIRVYRDQLALLAVSPPEGDR